MKLPSSIVNVFLSLFVFSVLYVAVSPFLPASFEAIEKAFEFLSSPASVTGPTDSTDPTRTYPPVAGVGGETG